MDLQSNMEVLGKRHPFLLRYKAGVDETGVAQFISMDLFSDSGFSFYDDTSYLAELHARVKTKLKYMYRKVASSRLSQLKLLQLKLIHIFARAILLMKKLEIEKTKPTFIITVLKVEY